MLFGLTAPYYQYFDLPESFCSNQKLCLSPRIYRSEIQSEFTGRDIEQRSFLIRYKNFMQSPRSHFIYYGVNIILIQILMNITYFHNFYSDIFNHNAGELYLFSVF